MTITHRTEKILRYGPSIPLNTEWIARVFPFWGWYMHFVKQVFLMLSAFLRGIWRLVVGDGTTKKYPPSQPSPETFVSGYGKASGTLEPFLNRGLKVGGSSTLLHRGEAL